MCQQQTNEQIPRLLLNNNKMREKTWLPTITNNMVILDNSKKRI